MKVYYNAIVELFCVLLDAWEAADLGERLREWWWVVHNPNLLDSKPPGNGKLNKRQERALQLAREFGRVTNATMRGSFPLYHPETIRLDLCSLVDRGLLARHGMNKTTYYVLLQQPNVRRRRCDRDG